MSIFRPIQHLVQCFVHDYDEAFKIDLNFDFMPLPEVFSTAAGPWTGVVLHYMARRDRDEMN